MKLLMIVFQWNNWLIRQQKQVTAVCTDTRPRGLHQETPVRIIICGLQWNLVLMLLPLKPGKGMHVPDVLLKWAQRLHTFHIPFDLNYFSLPCPVKIRHDILFSQLGTFLASSESVLSPRTHALKLIDSQSPPISKNSPASRLLRGVACSRFSIFKVMWVTVCCLYLSSALNVSYFGNKFCDRISCVLDVIRFYALGNVHCDIDVKCSVFWNSDFSLPLYVIWTEGRKKMFVSIALNLLPLTSSI